MTRTAWEIDFNENLHQRQRTVLDDVGERRRKGGVFRGYL